VSKASSFHAAAVRAVRTEFTAASSQLCSKRSLEIPHDGRVLTFESEHDDSLPPAKRQRTEDASDIWNDIKKGIVEPFGESAGAYLDSIPAQEPAFALAAECDDHTLPQTPSTNYNTYDASDTHVGEDRFGLDLGDLFDFEREETELDTLCFGMVR
jgi:hypothetical protein